MYDKHAPSILPLDMCRFAFRQGFSCTDFNQLHQLILEKAREFQKLVRFFIGDIRKAYDHMHHGILATCMDRCKICRALIALCIIQLRKAKKAAILGDIKTAPSARTTSTYQGGNEGPMLLDMYRNDTVHELLKKWEEQRCGLF